VTGGERLVCGWAQSWIRDAGRREVLFDLDMGFCQGSRQPVSPELE